MLDLEATITALVPTVQYLGQTLLEMHSHLGSTTSKGGVDVVTKADPYSEAFLFEHLRKHFPEHSIIAEEGSQHQGNAWCWHIDPLDGTANYSRQLPEWCISVGLSKGTEPVAGIIVAPQLQTTWFGGKGFGVFENGVACSPALEGDDPKTWIVGFDHPWDSDARIASLELIKTIANRVRMPSSRGAAAVALGYLCSGKLDAYVIKKAFSWDFCAGVAMANELGYHSFNWSQQPYSTPDHDLLVCRPNMEALFFEAMENIVIKPKV